MEACKEKSLVIIIEERGYLLKSRFHPDMLVMDKESYDIFAISALVDDSCSMRSNRAGKIAVSDIQILTLY